DTGGGGRPGGEGIQPVRLRARAQVRRAQGRARRLPSRALEKPDDGCRDGGKIPFPGAQAPAAGAARPPAASAVGARGHAEGGVAGRNDAGKKTGSTHQGGGVNKGALGGLGGIVFAVASGVAAAQGWRPPAESQRCPSKWGAGDERGAANHMKPETVLRATRLIRTGEVIELGHVLGAGMPSNPARVFNMITK